MTHSKLLPILAAAALAMAACNDINRTSDTSDVLVAVGNLTLTADDLSAVMPGGMTEDDSARFAHAFIRTWIDTQLISEIAAREVDMTEIDKMVDQYRKELIMWEYSRQMYDSHKQIDLPEDSIRAYYDRNPDEFVLKRPMVKGIYLKVADDSKDLPALRKLYRSTRQDDLDKIEKSLITDAFHYDYFLDKWVDLERIEAIIPYETDIDTDNLLRTQRHLDISNGGFTYLLNITDVLAAGSRMPYEVARDYIIDRLTFHDKRAYDLDLKQKLYENAVATGKITINCDLAESTK